MHIRLQTEKQCSIVCHHDDDEKMRLMIMMTTMIMKTTMMTMTKINLFRLGYSTTVTYQDKDEKNEIRLMKIMTIRKECLS